MAQRARRPIGRPASEREGHGGSDRDDRVLSRSGRRVSFCTLLLIAGNETTTNLLGNAFQAFFDYPDQHAAMQRSDNLATVVEEVVPYDSPVQGILRLTNEDLDLDGVTIPKDAVVLILFGSANRDETRWTDADRFDVGREPKDHLGFGSGIHLCLGAHLAHLETQIAFDVIRTRLRTLEPRAETVWGGSSILRLQQRGELRHRLQSGSAVQVRPRGDRRLPSPPISVNRAVNGETWSPITAPTSAHRRGRDRWGRLRSTASTHLPGKTEAPSLATISRLEANDRMT